MPDENEISIIQRKKNEAELIERVNANSSQKTTPKKTLIIVEPPKKNSSKKPWVLSPVAQKKFLCVQIQHEQQRQTQQLQQTQQTIEFQTQESQSSNSIYTATLEETSYTKSEFCEKFSSAKFNASNLWDSTLGNPQYRREVQITRITHDAALQIIAFRDYFTGGIHLTYSQTGEIKASGDHLPSGFFLQRNTEKELILNFKKSRVDSSIQKSETLDLNLKNPPEAIPLQGDYRQFIPDNVKPINDVLKNTYSWEFWNLQETFTRDLFCAMRRTNELFDPNKEVTETSGEPHRAHAEKLIKKYQQLIFELIGIQKNYVYGGSKTDDFRYLYQNIFSLFFKYDVIAIEILFQNLEKLRLLSHFQEGKETFELFVQRFLCSYFSCEQLLENEAIKAIEELTQLPPEALSWWNTLLRQHVFVSSEMQFTAQSTLTARYAHFSELFSAFKIVYDYIKQHNLKLPYPCPLNNIKNMKVFLSRLLTILKTNPLRAAEQLDYLAELDWSDQGAYYAATCDGYRLVTADMVLTPTDDQTLEIQKGSYSYSEEFFRNLCQQKSSIPIKKAVQLYFRYLGQRDLPFSFHSYKNIGKLFLNLETEKYDHAVIQALISLIGISSCVKTDRSIDIYFEVKKLVETYFESKTQDETVRLFLEPSTSLPELLLEWTHFVPTPNVKELRLIFDALYHELNALSQTPEHQKQLFLFLEHKLKIAYKNYSFFVLKWIEDYPIFSLQTLIALIDSVEIKFETNELRKKIIDFSVTHKTSSCFEEFIKLKQIKSELFVHWLVRILELIKQPVLTETDIKTLTTQLFIAPISSYSELKKYIKGFFEPCELDFSRDDFHSSDDIEIAELITRWETINPDLNYHPLLNAIENKKINISNPTAFITDLFKHLRQETTFDYEFFKVILNSDSITHENEHHILFFISFIKGYELSLDQKKYLLCLVVKIGNDFKKFLQDLFLLCQKTGFSKKIVDLILEQTSQQENANAALSLVQSLFGIATLFPDKDLLFIFIPFLLQQKNKIDEIYQSLNQLSDENTRHTFISMLIHICLISPYKNGSEPSSDDKKRLLSLLLQAGHLLRDSHQLKQIETVIQTTALESKTLEQLITSVDFETDYAKVCVDPFQRNIQKQFCDNENNVTRVIQGIKNLTTTHTLPFLEQKKLQQWFSYVNHIGYRTPIEDSQKPLKDLSTDELQTLITHYSALLQTHIDNNKKILTQLKMLAVLREMIYRSTGDFPTSTQIICGLATILHPQNLILGIATGQGKSLISALLASLFYLSGPSNAKINMSTANLELAKRDHLKFEKFFCALGIKTQVVIPSTTYKAYHETSIQFSTASSFSLFRTLKQIEGRAFDEPYTLIADEIDSEILDPRPQYRVAINLDSNAPLSEEDRVLCYQLINNYLDYEASKLPDADRETHAKQLQYYFQTQSILPLTEIQRHQLYSYSLQKLENWLDAARDARYLANTLDEKIDPPQSPEFALVKTNQVDSTCGKLICNAVIIDQESKYPLFSARWSRGTHQFLHARLNKKFPQFKFPIEPEIDQVASTTSKNFFDFYRKKQGKIIGLTATPGSDIECEHYRKTYQFSLFQIPTHEECKRTILTPRIVPNETEQIHILINELKEKLSLKPPMPVLIICKDGPSATQIKKHIDLFLEKNAYLKFFEPQLHHAQTETDEKEIIFNAGNPGQITIATSLTRGTDIKPLTQTSNETKIAHPHGLFGIDTFFKTRRLVDQFFGRTARRDQPGIAIIIATENDFSVLEKRPENLKKAFDALDKYHTEAAQTHRELNDAFYDLRNIIFEKFLIFMKMITEIENSNGIREEFIKYWQLYLMSLESLWIEIQQEEDNTLPPPALIRLLWEKAYPKWNALAEQFKLYLLTIVDADNLSDFENQIKLKQSDLENDFTSKKYGAASPIFFNRGALPNKINHAWACCRLDPTLRHNTSLLTEGVITEFKFLIQKLNRKKLINRERQFDTLLGYFYFIQGAVIHAIQNQKSHRFFLTRTYQRLFKLIQFYNDETLLKHAQDAMVCDFKLVSSLQITHHHNKLLQIISANLARSNQSPLLSEHKLSLTTSLKTKIKNVLNTYHNSFKSNDRALLLRKLSDLVNHFSSKQVLFSELNKLEAEAYADDLRRDFDINQAPQFFQRHFFGSRFLEIIHQIRGYLIASCTPNEIDTFEQDELVSLTTTLNNFKMRSEKNNQNDLLFIFNTFPHASFQEINVLIEKLKQIAGNKGEALPTRSLRYHFRQVLLKQTEAKRFHSQGTQIKPSMKLLDYEMKSKQTMAYFPQAPQRFFKPKISVPGTSAEATISRAFVNLGPAVNSL